MSVVRLLSDEDFDEYTRLSFEAYPVMYGPLSEEQVEAWKGRMQTQQSKKGSVQYAGCFRDEKLVGIMRMHSFEINVHGTMMKAMGVGNVAVDLTRRKEHVSKEMMEYYHQWCLDEGASFAVLWPFRPDYYVKMGYGYGRKMNKYMFRPGDLPRGSKEGVRFMGTDDVDALHACFNDYARGTHGMILKHRSFYERLFRRYKVVGFEKGRVVEGFIAFKFKKLMEDHFLLQNMEVEYFIYNSKEALGGLLAFLHTQLDQVERVEFTTMDDDLHFIAKDPRNGLPHIFFTSQESNIQGVGMMYRVLDKEGFIRKLDHDFNGVSLDVRFNVDDSFLPSNHGSLVVHFDEGMPVLGGSGFDVEVTLNVEKFSSLLMGVVDFKKLWMYGLVEVSDSSYVETLDRLFRVERKPETIEEF
jgi:predicted acetyltransferase